MTLICTVVGYCINIDCWKCRLSQSVVEQSNLLLFWPLVGKADCRPEPEAEEGQLQSVAAAHLRKLALGGLLQQSSGTTAEPGDIDSYARRSSRSGNKTEAITLRGPKRLNFANEIVQFFLARALPFKEISLLPLTMYSML